jgi:hypothetical protein
LNHQPTGGFSSVGQQAGMLQSRPIAAPSSALLSHLTQPIPSLSMHEHPHAAAYTSFQPQAPPSEMSIACGASTDSTPGQTISRGDQGVDEVALDLILETMDAWEASVTRRMHAAVDDAVKAARADVMQVRMPRSRPHETQHCTQLAQGERQSCADRRGALQSSHAAVRSFLGSRLGRVLRSWVK